jgi:hypothetical protein
MTSTARDIRLELALAMAGSKHTSKIPLLSQDSAGNLFLQANLAVRTGTASNLQNTIAGSPGEISIATDQNVMFKHTGIAGKAKGASFRPRFKYYSSATPVTITEIADVIAVNWIHTVDKVYVISEWTGSTFGLSNDTSYHSTMDSFLLIDSNGEIYQVQNNNGLVRTTWLTNQNITTNGGIGAVALGYYSAASPDFSTAIGFGTAAQNPYELCKYSGFGSSGTRNIEIFITMDTAATSSATLTLDNNAVSGTTNIPILCQNGNAAYGILDIKYTLIGSTTSGGYFVRRYANGTYLKTAANVFSQIAAPTQSIADVTLTLLPTVSFSVSSSGYITLSVTPNVATTTRWLAKIEVVGIGG